MLKINIALLALLSAVSLQALDTASGALTLNASGDTTVSGLAFTPNVVMLAYTYATADGPSQTTVQWAYGIKTTSEEMSFGIRGGQGSASREGHHTNNACLRLTNGAGGNTDRATCALTADGFTLTHSTGSTAIRVNWRAMAVTAAKLVSFETNTTTADQQVTGAGFRPDATMFFTSGILTTSLSTTSTSGGHPGMGFAASDTVEVGNGVSMIASNLNNTGSQSNSKLIYVPTDTGMWLEGDVKSIDADGITIQYATVQASPMIGWLLFLQGVSANAGSFNQPTSNGNSVVSGIGFSQKLIGLMSNCLVANTGQQVDARIAVGSATSGVDTASGIASNGGNNRTGQWIQSTQAIECRTAAASANPVLQSTGATSNFGAGTWTLTWSTTDATARQILWYALGDAASPPAGKRKVIIQ